MVETEGRNPPLPDDLVTSRQLRERPLVEARAEAQPQNPLPDRSSVEEEPDNLPLLPPNYVSLRQLQERRLKEKKEEKEREKGKEKVKESDNVVQLHPNYITLGKLEEQLFKEAKKKEEGGKEEKGKGDGRREQSRNHPLLPPNYVSLRQLQAERLKKGKEKEGEEGDGEKVKNKEKALEEDKEKGGNCPILPPNFVRMRKLKELRFLEKEQKRTEEMARLQQLEVQKEGEGTQQNKMDINYKACHMARNLQSKKPDNLGCVKSSLLWKHVLPAASTGSSTGTSSADAIFLPENETSSHEVVMGSSDQNGAPVMNSKNTWKKNDKKKKYRNRISGKDKNGPVQDPDRAMDVTSVKISGVPDAMFLPENVAVSHGVVMVSSDQNGAPVLNSKKKWKKNNKKKKYKSITSGKDKNEPVQDPDQAMEVTGVKISATPDASSSAPKEVTLSQNENNSSREMKGEKTNLTESSSQSIPVYVEVERYNRAQSRGETHNGRSKMKGKKVNLSEPSHNVVPMSELAKGSDVVKERIDTKIWNGKEQKGNRKMVDISESSDQNLGHEEAKGILGAGELIGSEVRSGEIKGRGKNVNMPELSQHGGEVGDHYRKKYQTAESRGRGHPRGGRFPVRPAENLRGGAGLVWVLKKSS
jgi:hypothetical protein